MCGRKVEQIQSNFSLKSDSGSCLVPRELPLHTPPLTPRARPHLLKCREKKKRRRLWPGCTWGNRGQGGVKVTSNRDLFMLSLLAPCPRKTLIPKVLKTLRKSPPVNYSAHCAHYIWTVTHFFPPLFRFRIKRNNGYHIKCLPLALI